MTQNDMDTERYAELSMQWYGWGSPIGLGIGLVLIGGFVALLAGAWSGFALRVPDVAAARRELEEQGVQFDMDTFDTGVCHMALMRDPDGNQIILHRRYAP